MLQRALLECQYICHVSHFILVFDDAFDRMYFKVDFIRLFSATTTSKFRSSSDRRVCLPFLMLFVIVVLVKRKAEYAVLMSEYIDIS